VSRDVGLAALALLKELVSLCGQQCLRRNPITTYEALVRGEAAYCPFAYGYSNYAREGYEKAREVVKERAARFKKEEPEQL